ncbi:MAG: GntR family transcriptional regulator, partial [Lachnospiraceae bacterium]|nr:GntR family transcriptional regulator [Lachnospiraceae bacterium]
MKLKLNDKISARYIQVYDYYKELIESGKMQENTKMPSIRKGAEQLGLSRTTIETAYLC